MKQWILLLIIIVFVGMMGLVGGWNLHKNLKPCLAPTVDSIFVWDTVTKVITNTVVKLYPDTILYPDSIRIPVDSTKIYEVFKNYYAKKVFNRHWEDTAIYVSLRDTTYQNSLYEGEFKYKYKLPTTNITNNYDNSITYNHYVVVGITYLLKDPKYYSLDLTYQAPKFYLGGQYYPELKGFGIRAGATIFHFKKKK
jgi:hypothetical protein